MNYKKFKGFLFAFHIVAWTIVWTQQGFAGTWTDAFEDNNTREWKIVNAVNTKNTWRIDKGEAVGETFAPHHNRPVVWATGEVDWRNYSFSCKAKLVKAKDEPATFGIILHHEWEEFSFYVFRIVYPRGMIHITKMNGASSQTLGEFDFAVQLDTWYSLTASIDSRGKLKFQIGDVVFTAVDRNPIKNGKAGLVVIRGQARFDDVEITGNTVPDGRAGTLPVEPSRKLATTWGALKR